VAGALGDLNEFLNTCFAAVEAVRQFAALGLNADRPGA
jgi:hypothetical protein